MELLLYLLLVWAGAILIKDVTLSVALAFAIFLVVKFLKAYYSEESKRERSIHAIEFEKQHRIKQKLANDAKISKESVEKAQASKYAETIKSIIASMKHRLWEERSRYATYDVYDQIDLSKWIGIWPSCPDDCIIAIKTNNLIYFQEGLGFFWYNVILPRVGQTRDPSSNAEIFFKLYYHYSSYYKTIKDPLLGERSRYPHAWIDEILWWIEEALVNSQNPLPNVSTSEMSGEEYEKYCQLQLENKGWSVYTTPKTGDQGVDLIAVYSGFRVCIQCKRYSSPVGNSAVQEVVAGKIYWQGTHAVVVSNAGFTSGAVALARSTKVLLINDLQLVNLILFLDDLGSC